MAADITVELGSRSYTIHLGAGTLKALDAQCKALGLGARCLVVTDTNVDPAWGEVCCASLRAGGFAVAKLVVPAGEPSKDHAQLQAIYTAALEHELDRRAFIVALGGGVVGDLAGYAAATYLRGIPYVQVPTSVVAMVDSAVGGKTGINLPQGKNLVGCFHQPAAVVVDRDTLRTLPEREYRSGLAEVVKYGVIQDETFFDLLEAQAGEVLAQRPGLVQQFVARSCKLKAEVVRLDEREGGLRAVLNFGHTLGHAVEKVAGYGVYLHGEAIAIGMVYAARLSMRKRGLPAEQAERLQALLLMLGLPVRADGLAWKDLRKAMAVDKKTQGGIPRFVLASALGTVHFGCEVDEATLAETWDELNRGHD